jgi:V8-like Glu-specific endopeptidase
MDHEVEEPEAQGAEMALATDNRYLVKDSHAYPHNAIAFMQMEFDLEDGDLGEFAGTGFMCQAHMFVTAAHNILRMSTATKNFARAVSLQFAVNGPEDVALTKMIELEGVDFSIPTDYKKPTDHCDIAWIDLQNYYDKKMKEGVDLDWSMDDLPTTNFHTCNIPKEPGLLKGDFHICGR